MKVRLYTTQNYLDLELKANIDKKILFEQLDAGNTMLAELTNGNDIIINTINIVAIEIITPPTQN